MGEVLTRSAVKETTIWFVAYERVLAEAPTVVLRSDTHRVTYHTNYISVAAINQEGDESSRVWYPWHTILRVEEKWLYQEDTK